MTDVTSDLRLLDEDEKLTLDCVEGQTRHGGAQTWNVISAPGIKVVFCRPPGDRVVVSPTPLQWFLTASAGRA